MERVTGSHKKCKMKRVSVCSGIIKCSVSTVRLILQLTKERQVYSLISLIMYSLNCVLILHISLSNILTIQLIYEYLYV